MEKEKHMNSKLQVYLTSAMALDGQCCTVCLFYDHKWQPTVYFYRPLHSHVYFICL